MRRPAVHSKVGALLLKVGAIADQLTVGRPDPGSVSSRAPPFLSPGDSIFCDNEAEMFMHGITFINGACCTDGAASKPQRSPGDPPQLITDDILRMQSHQGAESCGNSALPATCSTFACARTVRRVRDSCSRYFARDAFSAGTRDQIAALNRTCDASVVAPPRVLGFQGLRGQTVANVCGVRLTDGLDTRLGSATGLGATSVAADSESLYLTEQMGVTFVAPPGRLLAMDFELVWFPPGVDLKVYDGFDNKCVVAYPWWRAAVAPLMGTFDSTLPKTTLETSWARGQVATAGHVPKDRR
jgi:hypothetical protein